MASVKKQKVEEAPAAATEEKSSPPAVPEATPTTTPVPSVKKDVSPDIPAPAATVTKTQSDPFADMLKAAMAKCEPLGAETRRKQVEYLKVEPSLKGFKDVVDRAAQRVSMQNSRVRDNRDASVNVDFIKKACWLTFMRACVYWEAKVRPGRNHLIPFLLTIPMEVAFAIQLFRPYVANDMPTLFVDPDWVKRWMEREFSGYLSWSKSIDFDYNITLSTCGGASKTMGVMQPNLNTDISMLINTVYTLDAREANNEIVKITGPVLPELETLFLCKLKPWNSMLVEGGYDPGLTKANLSLRPILSAWNASAPIDWEPNWNQTIRTLFLVSRDGLVRDMN